MCRDYAGSMEDVIGKMAWSVTRIQHDAGKQLDGKWKKMQGYSQDETVLKRHLIQNRKREGG
jgi:hypothetical protein